MKHFVLIHLFIFTKVFAQDSTKIALENVTVTANIQPTELKKTARNVSVITAKEISAAPVKTLDGILQYALNVDVRSRSPFGVQTDISIRGGHYDQTLVMIDGVKMNDPQTGHHSFNLPVPINLIEKIEVLQGGASRVFGTSAFSGVINIITKKVNQNQLSVQVGAGQYGLKVGNLAGSFVTNHQSTIFSLEGISSDGYATNTAFDRKNLYVKSNFYYKNTSLNVSGGWLGNKFGASNFYHPKFYKQYEEIKSQFLIGQLIHNFNPKLQSTLTGSYRKHNDLYDFDAYRFSNPAFVNHHQTDVYNYEWKNRWINNLGTTSFGAEYRIETVLSNRLGDKMTLPKAIDNAFGQFYTNTKSRQNSSLFFEHLKKFDQLTLVGGTMFNVNSQFGNDWFPGLDVNYELTNSVNIYGSVNRSIRFPTFTEMYLSNSTIKGDANLKPEKAWQYEVGSKFSDNYSNASLSVFYKQMQQAIDKVKRPDKTVPTMENIEGLNSYGAEVSYQFSMKNFLQKPNSFVQTIQTNYAYIWANKKADGFQSFYTLNYLRHKLSVGASFRILDKLSLDTWYTYKKRMGSYQWDGNTPAQEYPSINLVDTRLNYSTKMVRVFVDCNNLLNKKYFEHGFVELPQRWTSIGVNVIFN